MKVPTTATEKLEKLDYCGWREHFNLRLDPALPLIETPGQEQGDCMLRRWGCTCASCVDMLAMPSLPARFAPNPSCILAPVVGDLNDFKRCTFYCKRDGGVWL